VDKTLVLEPSVLQLFKQMQPGCVVAGYSPDDMGARHNQSRQFLEALPLYHVYFTTKSFGVAELTALGCPRVEFVENAYDIHVHRPMDVTEAERTSLGAPVGFIGTGELERARSCAYLASHGIPVKVWGDDWDKFQRKTDGKFVVGGPSRYGDDYVKTICSFDINLCFLRRMNRDLQTQRSVEIPACGAFMLAERTPEHLGLFEEGKEAEFFSSDDELLRKVRHYLAHPTERRMIAENGRQRCLKSGYSYHERLRKMLEMVKNIQTELLAQPGNALKCLSP
jgi:spore maturation protein CgeB